jgi:Terminase large subunit, T4likevirus-type, N-terminal
MRSPSPAALDLARTLDPVRLMIQLGLKPEGWQRRLLRSNSRRLAVICARQTGKTTTTAVLAAHSMLYRPGVTVIVVSRAHSQSNILLQKSAEMLQRIAAPAEPKITEGRIVLSNGSRLISLPGNEKTVRGLSANIIIIDEAAQVDDKLFNAVFPMLGGARGRLIALSTPFSARGFFHRACNNDDGWEVIRVTAEESARYTAEDLEIARQTLDVHAYRREYLCEFVCEDSRYFDPRLVREAIDPTIEPLYFK